MLTTPASPLRFHRLLLTGAAGYLGRELRPRLKAYCEVLRLSEGEAKGGGAQRPSILADALEAIIGAFQEEEEDEPPIVTRADGSWLVAGWMQEGLARWALCFDMERFHL